MERSRAALRQARGVQADGLQLDVELVRPEPWRGAVGLGLAGDMVRGCAALVDGVLHGRRAPLAARPQMQHWEAISRAFDRPISRALKLANM